MRTTKDIHKASLLSKSPNPSQPFLFSALELFSGTVFSSFRRKREKSSVRPMPRRGIGRRWKRKGGKRVGIKDETVIIKKDFPIFTNHPDLVYLDSAATTLKPASVIAKEREYYEEYSANVARGLYPLSEQATAEYEAAREKVAGFVNAGHANEIVFTRGTTESINLVASSLEERLQPGDEILVTVAEHHSNFLPWQALCERTGATLKTIGIDDQGRIKQEDVETIVSKKTRIFAYNFVSNVLGAINPVKEIAQKVKAINPEIIVLVDAAQASAHLPIDVQDIGCDFLAFSSHKMFGPTGVGVLWGKYELLNSLRPYQYGGEMVLEARLDDESSIFKSAPHKFEAGTPNIAGVIGLGAAIDFIQSIGFETIRAHEKEMLEYATQKLKQTFGEDIHILGPESVNDRSGVIAFSLTDLHPHDIAHSLGEHNICIRAGQHCTHPLHGVLHIPATARLSVSVYTSEEDIDRLTEGLKGAQEILQA